MKLLRELSAALPYVLAGLLVDAGDSGHWGWLALIAGVSLGWFLVWLGTPLSPLFRLYFRLRR